MGLDVGDVGHPGLIGPGRLEPLLEPVLGNDRGLAAKLAGAAPVANLRSDPGQRRQSGNTVLRDAFTLVAQIVRQLAIPIDLAAVDPSLPDKLGLPRVFLRAMAQRLLEPCIEAAEMDPKHPAHGPDAKLLAMRPDERARHCPQTNGGLNGSLIGTRARSTPLPFLGYRAPR